MIRSFSPVRKWNLSVVLYALAVASLCGISATMKVAAAVTFTSLYSFSNLVSFNNSDGARPYAPLVEGSDGNYYGTSINGGTSGNGTVFKITPSGGFTALYSFSGGTDGSFPYAGLALGADGSLYGGTDGGGDAAGDGTLFKISPAGSLTTIYSFSQGANGYAPYYGLLLGSDGSFYGSTWEEGNGDGTLFKTSSAGTLTTLHSFSGSDGNRPGGVLVEGSDGDFYGVTQLGGTNGKGSIFKITPGGTLTTIYSFTGGTDGSLPNGGLVEGADGDFYGCVANGGGTNGAGTIYKVTTSGVLTTLHVFTGSADGASPVGTLALAQDGNFYGVTSGGGANSDGTLFSITPAGTLTTLWTFSGTDGDFPQSGIIQGSDGNFYGTTALGGTSFVSNASQSQGNGTLFKLSVPGAGSGGGTPPGGSIVVTTLADSGTGSLRAAIVTANTAPGSTITFQSGLTGTITLASPLPAITAGVTIQGPGGTVIAVDGATAYRPFIIQTSSLVAISGLTIQRGSDKSDGSGGGNGGANMYIGVPGTSPTLRANVVLNNVTFTGGVTTGNGGGAFFNNFSTVTATDCTMNGNTVSGSIPNGGAINNNFGTVSLTNCTLFGNSANAGGGAIMNYASGGTATLSLTNCTVSGNTAKTNGGAIWNLNGQVTLINTILYNDTGATGSEINNSGTGTSTSSDIEGGLSGTGITAVLLNINANPLLGSLANNGGETDTMALGTGSPCISAGTTTGAPSADQRGYLRPSPPSIGAWDDGTTIASGQTPVIASTLPASVVAGSGGFALTLFGTGFIPLSNVNFGGLLLSATLNSNGTLTVNVPATAIANIGMVSITVVNSNSTGGTSAPYLFSVVPVAPTISSITPNLAPEGSTAFPITLSGTNFTSTCVVTFAGVIIPSTFHSSLSLSATIPASLLANVGSYQVTVTTTGAAGATSIPQFFNVVKPITTIRGLSPTQAIAGQAGFTLAILGTNYMPGATVLFNDSQVNATYVSSTEVDASIPAGDLGSAGSFPVTITNPVPAGGASSTTFFTVATANTFLPGLAMISVPTSYAGTSIQNVFGYSNPVLAIWDPAVGNYNLIHGSDTTSLVPGPGFWVRFPQVVIIPALGSPTPPEPFAIPLTAGWNMIGDPFLDEIPFSSLSITLPGGNSESFESAQQSGVIDSPLYQYATNPSRYILAGALDPYVGYWINVSTNCTLVVDNP